MKIYVIVGENRDLQNVSARAAYSTREAADAHLADLNRMWFDDRATVVELELDGEIVPEPEIVPYSIERAL